MAPDAKDKDLGLLVSGKTADLCNHVRHGIDSLPQETASAFGHMDVENSVLRLALVRHKAHNANQTHTDSVRPCCKDSSRWQSMST